MNAASASDPLQYLSAALAGFVAAAAPAIVSVHSHRSRSSGVVWKPGLIVTADEALAEDGEIALTFAGGRQTGAAVVGRDPTTDLALLRADTGDAAPLAFHEAVPRTGTLAIALGAQEGAPLAALALVAMSGPGWRSMRGGDIDARIELDAALRREAEGGLALDAEGRGFGMTVFGPRRRVLVIPSATIARVATELAAKGKVARGYLGLGLQPVRLDGDAGLGAMVMSVDPEGPGARAGIHQGDVIQAWNGRPVGSVQALLRSLGPASVGTSVVLSLRQGGETRTVDLTVGERP